MLFVKKIEVVDVDRDRVENIIIDRSAARSWDPITRETEETFQTEIVEGQRFVNSRGEELCIGMTTAAREALGLPFEIYEDMYGKLQQAEREIDRQKSIVLRQYQKMMAIKEMSWWERFNRLWIGY